jgi:ribosome biogenesis GTPase
MSLPEFGWNDPWKTLFAPHAAAGLEPARVVCELRRKFYAVQTADGEKLGECVGRFFHETALTSDFPAVGDWVAVRPRTDGTRVDIHAVLPRRTKFSRRAAGEQDIEQVVAANVDTVLLLSGLDRNYNPARIQRFVVAARESGAEPVVVLNKADLHPDPAAVRAEIERLVPGVPVFVTSTKTRLGLKALAAAYAQPGSTLALIGSSGVGKSTLINRLVRDDALPTGEVREKDSKGRHTTTRRELVLTPSGALLIDTPGMRELQLWDAAEGVEEAFADVASLALRCRFGNCRHETEPGCAVRAALESGELPPERWTSYRKLRATEAAEERRRDKAAEARSRAEWKKIHEGQRSRRQFEQEG